jgi:hypothetical protein
MSFVFEMTGINQRVPTTKEASPIAIKHLLDLMKSVDKFIATGKGQNLQKTNLNAHAQQFKWNKFQLGFKNCIKHFLHCNGDHPAKTLQVIFGWDVGAGKTRNSYSFFVRS